MTRSHLWTPLLQAWPLAKRDVLARYRGSLAGLGWALLAPLLLVAIYGLVFRGVFQARWGSSGADGMGYVLRLFAGLTLFTAVAEVATRATRLVQDNANLVKRVVFPVQWLALSLLLQVAVHSGLQVLVLGLGVLVFGDGPRLSWLLLPLAWLWLALLQYALALALAATGAYVRDLQHLVPLSMSGLLFLSPVFYPISAAPVVLQGVLWLNPLTAPIELTRAAWFGDSLPATLVATQAVGLVLLVVVARWLFARLRPGFADLV